jgi:hypothetical protein
VSTTSHFFSDPPKTDRPSAVVGHTFNGSVCASFAACKDSKFESASTFGIAASRRVAALRCIQRGKGLMVRFSAIWL